MKRATVVGLAAGAAALVVVVAGVGWLLVRPQSAEDAARDYLDALAAGDYATISSMRAGSLAGEAEDLIEPAFVGASAYIGEPRITEVATDRDGIATVSAEAMLDGEPTELEFAMQSTGGGWMLIADYLGGLRVDTALGSGQGGDSVWIGDALAPARSTIALLPAVYEVQAAPRGLLSGTATAAVGDAMTTVRVETALTAEATTAAQTRLDAYMDQCAATTDAVPENCGLKVPWAVDFTSLDRIAFRIDERPAVELSADGSSFHATGGVIVATATGTPRGSGPATATYRAEDWALRGSVRFTGEEMVLAVR